MAGVKPMSCWDLNSLKTATTKPCNHSILTFWSFSTLPDKKFTPQKKRIASDMGLQTSQTTLGHLDFPILSKLQSQFLKPQSRSVLKEVVIQIKKTQYIIEELPNTNTAKQEDDLGQAHSTQGPHVAQHSWQFICSPPLQWQSDIQLKHPIMSLYQTVMIPVLAKKKYPILHSHTLCISLLFGTLL